MSKKTAGKLFRLAHFADRYENLTDVWDAVADPDFPVRRGRFTLANGETVELTQTEANGDADLTRRFAMVDPDRLHQRPHNGGDLLTGGLMMGGPRGVRPRTGVNIPNQSANEEHEEGADVDAGDPPRDRNRAPHSGHSEGEEVEILPGFDLPIEKGTRKNTTNRGKWLLETLDPGTADRWKEDAEHATIKAMGKGSKHMEMEVDLPAERADQLIDDIAGRHGEEPKLLENGTRVYTDPNGVTWNAHDRTTKDGRRGVFCPMIVHRPGKPAIRSR